MLQRLCYFFFLIGLQQRAVLYITTTLLHTTVQWAGEIAIQRFAYLFTFSTKFHVVHLRLDIITPHSCMLRESIGREFIPQLIRAVRLG